MSRMTLGEEAAPRDAAAFALADAERIVREEARHLDERRWQDWLDLYAEDAWFWLPSWRNWGELVEDPDRELSLIYYETRARLEERIWRITSGRSPASVPLRRTLHLVSDVRPIAPADRATAVRSSFVVHVHDVRLRASHAFFGHYEHAFRRTDGGWKIAGKKIVLLNDHLPTTLDVYSI